MRTRHAVGDDAEHSFVPMFYVVVQRLGEGRLFRRRRPLGEQAEA
jgi:hypothetical protein